MNEPGGERDPFEVVAEAFLARYRAGERPSIHELAALHPELAEQIRELLPALVMVEQDLTIDPGPDVASSVQTAIPGSSRQLGDYRLLREIGRGGMGVVYEAEQISLGRRVALKILPASVTADRMALERFRREAKAAARLHHTNIVPVFEVGHSGDVAYFAMQFIQGQGLDQVIEELRRLDGTEADELAGAWRPGRLGASGQGTMGPPAGTQGRSPGEVTRLLRSGRFGGEGPDSLADAASAAIGHDAESTLFDTAPRAVAGSRGAGRPIVAGPPTAEASSSAVLPGGTAVSMVGPSARRRPFFRSVAHIGRQAAQGLAHAHARGIVHRDIKPSNLLLDTAGVVWIADFGLAKAEDDGLTATGDVLGTLRYMAPERFRGEGDARADIYALGLTLYELTTLRTAHDSSDRLGLIERIKEEEPPRPRSLDDRVPRDLETIILKAINKDPARRYPTAEAMAEDLRRFLNDETIQARRASPAERYARWARHHPTIAALGAVLTAVLALSTIVSFIVAGRMSELAANEKNAATAERTARTAAVAETYRATLSEVKALRAGREPGWRELALHSLARLAAMPTPRRDLPDLRTEAAAALGTPDIRLVARIALPGVSLGSFTFSPDGRTLLTADRKAGLDFWDVPGNRHLSSVQGLTVSEGAIARDKVVYLPGGQGLAVGTDQGVVFTDPRGVRTARAPIARGSSKPAKLSLSADGRRIAVAWAGGAGITVHDSASGDLLDEFRGANANFALSADGARIALQEGSEIVVRPIASGEQRIALGRHGGTTALALSPDGAVLASAIDHTFASATDHTTVLWDVAKREQLGVLRGHRGRVTDVEFSPDGEWIATGSFDYTTRIWEARTGQSVAILHGSPITVYAVKWSPSGDHLAVGNPEEVLLFKIAGRHRVRQWLTGHRIEQSRLAAHPRLERLATSGFEELNVWDLSVPRPSPVALGPNPGYVYSLAYSPDGSLLAHCHGLDLLIRDANSGAVRGRFPVPASVDALAFDPSGGRIACGDRAGNVLVWDLAAGRRIRQFATGSAIGSVAFLDGPRRLVTHGRGAVLLFNLESGELERKADLADGGIQRFVYDRPRGRLVVGFQSGAIGGVELPDLAAGPRLEHAHDGGVLCMALSPDARLLATIGADRRAVLRDATTFEALLKFPPWDGTPMNLTFDSTGRRLAIVGTGEDVDVWDLHALRDGLTEIGLAWERPASAVASASRAGPEGEYSQPVVPVVRRPGTADPAAHEQASRLVQSGVGAFQGGRWADAIRDLQGARDRLRALHRAAPGDGQVAGQLGMSLGFLAGAFRNERRPAEALASLLEAREVFESIREPSHTDFYNLACVYAGLGSLAGPGDASPNPAERQALADRAMESLRRSLADGMSDFALMDRDPDLDPLRGRPDFRSLVLDRGFPRDAFARAAELPPSIGSDEPARAELLNLSAAVAQRPSDFHVYFARGQFFARRREWPRALSDFRRALELHPPESWADQNGDTWFGFVAGLVFLQADDREGHRSVARAMLRKFAGSDLASTRDRTAKINLFVDPSAEDLDEIGALAERSVRLGRADPGLCWLQLTRGMASYRSGDLAASVDWLRQAEGSGLDDLSRALARIYLAMAEHRLGHAEQARALFQQAGHTLDAEARPRDWGHRWFSIAETDFSRREAEAMIFGAKPQPAESTDRGR